MTSVHKSFSHLYSNGSGSVEDKVQYLEKNLDILRAEVDIKMKIMEQILTTRNEQFVVQKKLIEKEHALYQSVMNHWKNTADLAASGQSIRYSKNVQDFEVFETTSHTSAPLSTKRASTASAFESPLERIRLRAKRLKTSALGIGIQPKTEVEELQSDSDEEEANTLGSSQGDDLLDSDDVEMNTGLESDPDGARAEDVGIGMQKRVFVNFYNEEPSNPEEGSSDPIWLHFLHEEGKGTSALCKKCDEHGYSQIYKLQTASLSVLRQHLKRKHKITVEVPPAVEDKPLPKSDQTESNLNGPRKVNFLRHNNHLYRRYCVRKLTEYWKCRDFNICGGKVIRRKDGNVRVTTEHTCLTSAADCDAVEFKERLKEVAASNPLLPPPDVIAIAKEGFSQEVLEIIPNDSALRKTISRIRLSILESVAEEASDWK